MSDSPAKNLVRKWEKDAPLIKGTLALLPEMTGLATCTGLVSVSSWGKSITVTSESATLIITLEDGVDVACSDVSDGSSSLTVTRPDVWECSFVEVAS